MGLFGGGDDWKMAWKVVFDAEFKLWLRSLDKDLEKEISTLIDLLRKNGPTLSRPYSDTLKGSNIKNLKELRLKFKAEHWRILYAFDPIRRAILLLGGNKTGDPNWYKKNIPIAEKRFFKHLADLEQEDVNDI